MLFTSFPPYNVNFFQHHEDKWETWDNIYDIKIHSRFNNYNIFPY